MSHIVSLPPQTELLPDGSLPGGWWHTVDEQEGRVVCDLCPRACSLKPGDRGFCFVRENRDGQMVLTTYGRSTGFCIDPIEKKPLNHFYPGTSVLSFGTAGCNLGCKFCQNWDISKSREIERLSQSATPETIAEAARSLGCKSVAYTYNDPVIWAEYAIDTARACRAAGVKNVAVTAGYIMPEARAPFFHEMDAANVDLKAFTEEFYHKITYSHIEPVLETLLWLKHESEVWFEITNLVIPRANDSPDELRAMCDWILANVGDEVPLHFTAFHPDFRMTDRPNTPHETLLAAYEIARGQGIKYVYVGNVYDARHDSTYCAGCGKLVIERNWHELGAYHLHGDRCDFCGHAIAGRFDQSHSDWGRRRMPVRIADFAKSAPAPSVVSPSAKKRPFAERKATMNGPAPSSENSISGRVETTGTKGTESTNRTENCMRKDSSEGTEMKTETTSRRGLASAFFTTHQAPRLSESQERLVHQAACRMVAGEVTARSTALPDPDLGGAAKLTVMGAFVTLKRQGRLRGCCGTLGQPMSLIDAMGGAARRTATGDVRLPPVSRTELPHLDLSVSLLHSFEPLKAAGRERVKAIEIGKHGLQIARGDKSGLLLPVVAVEHRLDAEEFLRQVCRKAGLPSTAWQDDSARITAFQVRCVDAPFDTAVSKEFGIETSGLFAADEFQRLAEHCHQNVLALMRGATPNYYLPGVPDGNVPGVILSVHQAGHDPTHFVKFSMRPGVPLQASLFNLAEAAAASLRDSGISPSRLDAMQVGITVLHDTAMHGTITQPDLSGIDPPSRAVLVTEGNKSAWIFDPQKTTAELVQTAAEQARIGAAHLASIFSLAVETTEPSLMLTTAAHPLSGARVRKPAVAGAFYPADADDLNKLVDACLSPTKPEAEAWPAAMVPHAGLIYSGRIAGRTLERLAFPETLIVIGPKHTRLGVDWAVTPHETWSLPGGDVPCDAELARRLAAGIPGLELDAAAHQNEHAIEVELPLIRRLAPQSRVVGIAIGASELDRCREFARSLAGVLQQEQRMPLLVISSDMNHFASDAENRRLDEMALAALEKLDPAALYETVFRHQISMCGVLPAVIVMETLRELGKLSRCQRVAYGTSADVSGDKSRVVGYAGLLLG